VTASLEVVRAGVPRTASDAARDTLWAAAGVAGRRPAEIDMTIAAVAREAWTQGARVRSQSPAPRAGTA
jgi:hypothetical protein